MKKKIFLVFFILPVLYIRAQQVYPQVICAGSGVLDNGAANINWTIGESVILTAQSSGNQLSSGFGQPDYVVTSVVNYFPELEILLYPNPSRDLLFIQPGANTPTPLSYALFDISGKMIVQGNLGQAITSINCSKLQPAIYLLNIFDTSKKILQSYKIVKQ